MNEKQREKVLCQIAKNVESLLTVIEKNKTSAQNLVLQNFQQECGDKKDVLHIDANIVEKFGMIFRAITENIARRNVLIKVNTKFVQNVKSAGNLCDICATYIAHILVEIRNLDFNKEELLVFLHSTQELENFFHIQNLAQFVEAWENIDIIPTTISLIKLFGFVQPVIKDYTPEIQKFAHPPFLYRSKTSPSERNAGLTERCHHPTLKPISLNAHLASLLLPPEAYKPRRILVPFAGVASEMIGCFQAGWDCVIGVELEDEYVAIGRQRLEYWLSQGVQLQLL